MPLLLWRCIKHSCPWWTVTGGITLTWPDLAVCSVGPRRWLSVLPPSGVLASQQRAVNKQARADDFFTTVDINKLVIDGQALANLRFRPIIKFMRQLRLGGSRAPLHRLRQVLYKMSSVLLGSDLSIGMCMLLIRLITVNGRWKWKVRLIYERCIARKHIISEIHFHFILSVFGIGRMNSSSNW